MYKLDVKSTFLHGELNKNMYVEQPKGFKVEREIDKVYKLRKTLYVLKHAPRAWYIHIQGYIKKKEFEKCLCEHTLFIKQEGESVLIVSLYVDDLIYKFNGDSSKYDEGVLDE